MMVKYLELTFQIDSEPDPQRAKVRPSLTVEDLITNIASEFETGEAVDYELYREGVPTPLARSEPLEVQQIKSGETLIFMRPILQHRRPIYAKRKASLELHGTETRFLIQWQPAVIGRPDADPVHSGLLAVNLEWHPNNRRISRRHAQITEEEGIYYIESLAANNPTYLNQDRLAPGERYPLKHNDLIYLRSSKVRLKFILYKSSDGAD